MRRDLQIPGKVTVMTKNTEMTEELGSIPQSSEHSPPRKPYESPQLKEWGSIAELTGSGFSGFDDVNNDQGSEAV